MTPSSARRCWSEWAGPRGRSEQGSTDHIKVKVKNNNYGLGTTASYEDNWIAHQDDFNELLAQLNNCHGQNNSTEPPAGEQQGFSLEAKSKTSKKRVHYMKFTKGKDLSSRTETDLNCIFGKRGLGRPTKDQEQDNSSSDSQGEAKETISPASLIADPESITKTVTSTLTMQEYFAQRMAQLKKAQGQVQNTEPSAADETSTPSDEVDPNLGGNNDSEEPRKKKKKKSKKTADEQEAEEEFNPVEIEDNNEQEQERPRKKKKKKRKAVDCEEATEASCISPSAIEQNRGELPPSKKKKKKKHKNHIEETELTNGHASTNDQTEESEIVQKKRKKHREEVDSAAQEDQVEVVEKKSKKDKKKKKKQLGEGEN
ncbi:PIN2/TERF1-interacting telomerase inhibitor 1 [Xyrichtys novacula]|uniref:PIN2/TERF1-interacting telomerase inhibitor 1 n=1 Tax=Xyrichtys novacula TaxID=13765 RepID=A0AAV1GY56_XYRNO|nr:PIN2/TERF1-interacting telomerase inhibitor 1 [Xyrichtys novacula]